MGCGCGGADQSGYVDFSPMKQNELLSRRATVAKPALLRIKGTDYWSNSYLLGKPLSPTLFGQFLFSSESGQEKENRNRKSRKQKQTTAQYEKEKTEIAPCSLDC
jgi:hypothetical protein